MPAIMFLYYILRAVLCSYNNGSIVLWATRAVRLHLAYINLPTILSLFQDHERTVRAFQRRQLKWDHNYEVSLHNFGLLHFCVCIFLYKMWYSIWLLKTYKYSVVNCYKLQHISAIAMSTLREDVGSWDWPILCERRHFIVLYRIIMKSNIHGSMAYLTWEKPAPYTYLHICFDTMVLFVPTSLLNAGTEYKDICSDSSSKYSLYNVRNATVTLRYPLNVYVPPSQGISMSIVYRFVYVDEKLTQ